MTEKMLGKISRATYGLGGYQGVQLGIHLAFEGKGWGCGHSDCVWDYEFTESPDAHTKWSETDRTNRMITINRKLSRFLKEAKVDSVSELAGIPVEVTFENNGFKEFRILTEVL